MTAIRASQGSPKRLHRYTLRVVSESGKQSFRQEVIRKAMVAFKAGEKFRLSSHARVREAIEQYLFEERRDG